MFDLNIIKFVLSTVGIHKLAVKFDDPTRRIVAKFTTDGQEHTQFIKYTEIEDLFREIPAQASEGPVQAPTGPLPGAPPSEGP